MNIAPMIGVIGTAFIGLIVFAYQKRQDRRYQIMAERRALYELYAIAMAPLMFRVIDPKSPDHVKRLNALNEMAAKLRILASPFIYTHHEELMKYLDRKLEGKYDRDEVEFFDEQALQLYETTIDQMRRDALPRDMW